jgi:hypothetical protein
MFKWLSLIPQAFSIAKVIEAEIPISGQGKAKLDAGLAIGQAAFETEQDLQKSWGNQTAFLAALVKAIGIAVALLNAAGVFTSKATAPAAQ